jgi:hypothetical protein
MLLLSEKWKADVGSVNVFLTTLKRFKYYIWTSVNYNNAKYVNLLDVLHKPQIMSCIHA